MNTKSCGIVVATKLNTPSIIESLAQLQKICTTKRYPLALVYIIDYQKKTSASEEQLNELTKLENDLNKCNIPLIMLIGDYDTRLVAVKNHYKPELILNADSHSENTNKQLESHPISWSSKVIPISELRPITYKKQGSC